MYIEIKCPHCKARHTVKSGIWLSTFTKSDMEQHQDYETIECGCGSELDIDVQIEVHVDIDITNPEIWEEAKQKESLGINAPYEIPNVVGPNQIPLF